MKSIKLLLIAGLSLVVLASCDKSDTPDPQNSIQGRWKGTYTFTGGGIPSYFLLEFKSGGLLGVEANNEASPELGTGTYTLVGDSVKGSFIYTIGIGINYNFAARYSPGSNVMSGTIGIAPSNNNSAVFTVTKQ